MKKSGFITLGFVTFGVTLNALCYNANVINSPFSDKFNCQKNTKMKNAYYILKLERKCACVCVRVCVEGGVVV